MTLLERLAAVPLPSWETGNYCLVEDGPSVVWEMQEVGLIAPFRFEPHTGALVLHAVLVSGSALEALHFAEVLLFRERLQVAVKAHREEQCKT